MTTLANSCDTVSNEVPLPTQDQLYAVFMSTCGYHRVKKQSAHLSSLLEAAEFEPKTLSEAVLYLQAREEAKRQPAASEQATAGNVVATENVKAKESKATVATNKEPATSTTTTTTSSGEKLISVIPMSLRTEIPMGDRTVYWGNSNLLILIELMRHLPLIERVDWSTQNVYDCDAYKLGPSGNEVLTRLLQWATTHPTVSYIDIRNQAIGTEVGRNIRDAVIKNSHLKTVLFDELGVDAVVLKAIQKALAANVKGSNSNVPPPWQLDFELASVTSLDRKSSCDRRQLHVLLWDYQAAFAPLESEDARSKFVMKATKKTTAECENAVRGLRGDGSNLVIVLCGEMKVSVGSQTITLSKGDYFGEPEESVMYVAGQLSVSQRGHIFAVPLTACAPMLDFWSKKVLKHLDFLKTVAIFQGLPTWCLIRACHELENVTFAHNALAISKGSTFTGLYIVTKGSFMVRGRAKKGQAPVVFTAGDVFGEEAALARGAISTVDIKAVDDECNECLLVCKHVALKHFTPLLKTAFAIQARTYSEIL